MKTTRLVLFFLIVGCAPAVSPPPATVVHASPASSAGVPSEQDEPASPVTPAAELERFSSTPDDAGPFGYRERGGRVVIEPRFEVADEFTPEGLACVADDQGWAYIDRTGRVLVRPMPFDNACDPFEDGLARLVVDGKFGFFDTRGRVVIPPRFDFACGFSEGLACFCEGCAVDRSSEHGILRGGRWGYLDKTGEIVIPLQFDAPSYFMDGKAAVRRGGVPLTIDRTGSPVAP